jgi:hypothetical protein
MWYEINVSLNGKHYFATNERSIRTLPKAMSIAEHFKKVFPANDGYEVEVTEHTQIAKRVAK